MTAVEIVNKNTDFAGVSKPLHPRLHLSGCNLIALLTSLTRGLMYLVAESGLVEHQDSCCTS